uniref:Lipoprotein n=1 Tax=uncultured bacterium contig00063 TaxID=1181546 RepID=A0A806JYY9_9BACT|nr:hypothetical protein [uncultured bacterium contig00063]
MNFWKILATLAIALVLAACPNGTDSGSGGTLKLSGQVYERGVDTENLGLYLLVGEESIIKYDNYSGSDASVFDENSGGSGSIKDGRLDFSIGKPDDALLSPVAELNDLLLDEIGIAGKDGIYAEIDVNHKGANFTALSLVASGDPEYAPLTRENLAIFITNREFASLFPILPSAMSLNIVTDTVSYMYVDSDVTITAKGAASTYSIEEIEELAEISINELLAETPVNVTAEDINLVTHNIDLKLKKGWNAVRGKLTIIIDLKINLDLASLGSADAGTILGMLTENPELLDIAISEINGDMSISASDVNPSTHYWVINN